VYKSSNIVPDCQPVFICYHSCMDADEFIIHSCEQILRFTHVESWDSLSEARKVQLAFNMGVVSLGLKLSKVEGFDALADARERRITMQTLRDCFRSLINLHSIEVDEMKIIRPF
jgi:hypothetical protein